MKQEGEHGTEKVARKINETAIHRHRGLAHDDDDSISLLD